MDGFNASDEQKKLLKVVKKGNHALCNAVAGSGKTTSIVYIAESLPKHKILQITYNSMLKEEVREKAQDINNLTVENYHSLAVKYYNKMAYDDKVLKNIILEDISPQRKINGYDIIVIDETQDITPLLYSFLRKFIQDHARNFQFIILGDERQCIYSFMNADKRFLTLFKKISAKDKKIREYIEPDFINCTLNTSYRITNSIARFVNEIMLGRNLINAPKKGKKVKYVVDKPWNSIKIVSNILLDLLQNEEKEISPEDIFVLAPSTKGKFFRELEVILVKEGIPCYGSTSDNVKIDTDIIKGKVVFSTIHQSKGRERKIVVLFGFDETYFKFFSRDSDPYICSPTLYVGITRASEQLILLHDEGNRPLPFLKNPVINNEYIKILGSGKIYDVGPDQCDTEKGKCEYHKTSVTELVKYLKEESIDMVDQLIEQIFEPLHQARTDIYLKGKVKTDEKLYEDVSRMNGIMIPAMYESFSTEQISEVQRAVLKRKNEILASKNKNGELAIFMSNAILPDDEVFEQKIINKDVINMFLQMTNCYVHIQEKYLSQLVQIDKYEWLSKKDVKLCLQNMEKRVRGEHEYEVTLKDNNGDNFIYESEYGTIEISGIIDAVGKKNVWEFKCVDDLTIEHYLQLAVYAFLWKKIGNPHKIFKLFNIRSGEIMQIRDGNPELDLLLELILNVLIDNKYAPRPNITDKNFIKMQIK